MTIKNPKPKCQSPNEMAIFGTKEPDIPRPPEPITQEMLDYYSIPITNKDYMEQVNKIFNCDKIPKSKCQSPNEL